MESEGDSDVTAISEDEDSDVTSSSEDSDVSDTDSTDSDDGIPGIPVGRISPIVRERPQDQRRTLRSNPTFLRIQERLCAITSYSVYLLVLLMKTNSEYNVHVSRYWTSRKARRCYFRTSDGTTLTVSPSPSSALVSRRSWMTQPPFNDDEMMIDGDNDVVPRQQILFGHLMTDPQNIIGEGGQAYVHRIDHGHFGQVAAKVYRKPRDFLRAYPLTEMLPPSSFIAQPYGFVYLNPGDSSPIGYIMECLDTSLDKVIHKKDSSLPDYTTNQALRIIKKTCAGLFHLHTYGIMHRDIKPANILVSRNLKSVKICDFGSLQSINGTMQDEPKMQSVKGKRTVTISSGVGTYGYMAPEVMTKEFNTGSLYTEKCDVYSWAITAWEILSKQALPYSEDPLKIEKEVLDEIRPDLNVISLGKKINSLFRSAWHPDPNERPSMLEINSILFFKKDDEKKWLESIRDSNGMFDNGAFTMLDSRSLSSRPQYYSARRKKRGRVLVESVVAPVFGQVAVKYLGKEHSSQTYKLIKKLKMHPNIVRTFGFCSEEGRCCGYFMELLDLSLHQVVHRMDTTKGVLPEYSTFGAVDIIRKICRGIQYLHQQGIVHGNIKPHNVLVSFDLEAVKLCGFESIKKEHGFYDSYVFRTEKVEYMAPELMVKELLIFNKSKCDARLGKWEYLRKYKKDTWEYRWKERDYEDAKRSFEENVQKIHRRSLSTPDKKACDVYSAAITCWEIFHRRVPYKLKWGREEREQTDVESLVLYEGSMHLESQLFLGGHRPSLKLSPLNEEMKNLLRRLWDHDPVKRPSISQFLNNLDKAFSSCKPTDNLPIEYFLGEFTAAKTDRAFLDIGRNGMELQTITIREAKEKGFYEYFLKSIHGRKVVSPPWKPDNIERNGNRYWIEQNALIRSEKHDPSYYILTDNNKGLILKEYLPNSDWITHEYFYSR